MYSSGSPPQLSGFPSECMEMVPDRGFRWLCGEPVAPEAQWLIDSSLLADPVVHTVMPTGVYIPAPDEDPVTPETVYPDDPEVDELFVFDESGYGIIPWIAGLFMTGLMARAMS